MFSKFLYFTALVFVVTACTSNSKKMEPAPRCPQSEGNGHIGSGDTGSSKPFSGSPIDITRSKCYRETPTKMEQIYVMAALTIGHPIYAIHQMRNNTFTTSNFLDRNLYFDGGVRDQFYSRLANSKSCWQAISEYANFESANRKSLGIIKRFFPRNEYLPSKFDQNEEKNLFELMGQCNKRFESSVPEWGELGKAIDNIVSILNNKLGRKTVLGIHDIHYSLSEYFVGVALKRKAKSCEDLNRAYEEVAEILLPADIEMYNSLKKLNYDIDQYLVLQ